MTPMADPDDYNFRIHVLRSSQPLKEYSQIPPVGIHTVDMDGIRYCIGTHVKEYRIVCTIIHKEQKKAKHMHNLLIARSAKAR